MKTRLQPGNLSLNNKLNSGFARGFIHIMTKKKITTSIFFSLLFLLFGLTGICHHELWQDEAHHFLLGRDSISISDLLYNARYDGHPLLWNILIFLITRISQEVIYMQLLHVGITLLAAFLFLNYAPFGLKTNLLFIFSYFFFYEYYIISRNYGISLCLIIISCILLTRKNINYPATAIVLAILANTHLFSTIISVACATILLTIMLRNQVRKDLITLCGLVFLSGLVIVVLSIVPPEDHFLKDYNSDSLLSIKRIGKAASVVLKGLLPFPDITSYHSWNTNLFISISKKAAMIPVGLFLFLPLLLFINKPVSLFVFYFCSALIMVFVFLSPLIVGSRHCGFIFLAFLVSLWLEKSMVQKPFNVHPVLLSAKQFLSKPFLIIILLIQVFAGMYAYVKDICFPFSESKSTSAYIKSMPSENTLVALSNHFSGPPVSAYLKKKIFYIENYSYQSFCLWNTRPFMISNQSILEKVNSLRKETPVNQTILLVLNYNLNDSLGSLSLSTKFPEIKFTFLRQFDKSMMRSENYYLYMVDQKN